MLFIASLLLHSSSRQTNRKRNNRAPVSLLSQDLKYNIYFHFFHLALGSKSGAALLKWTSDQVKICQQVFQKALVWQALKKLTGSSLSSSSKIRTFFKKEKRRKHMWMSLNNIFNENIVLNFVKLCFIQFTYSKFTKLSSSKKKILISN